MRWSEYSAPIWTKSYCKEPENLWNGHTIGIAEKFRHNNSDKSNTSIVVRANESIDNDHVASRKRRNRFDYDDRQSDHTIRFGEWRSCRCNTHSGEYTSFFRAKASVFRRFNSTMFVIAEKIHSSGGHNVRWSFDYWCRAHRSVRFNRRCTDHCVHHYTNQFSRIVAKQFQFTTNNGTSCLRPSAWHIRFDFIRGKTAFYNSQWYVKIIVFKTVPWLIFIDRNRKFKRRKKLCLTKLIQVGFYLSKNSSEIVPSTSVISLSPPSNITIGSRFELKEIIFVQKSRSEIIARLVETHFSASDHFDYPHRRVSLKLTVAFPFHGGLQSSRHHHRRCHRWAWCEHCVPAATVTNLKIVFVASTCTLRASILSQHGWLHRKCARTLFAGCRPYLISDRHMKGN